MTAKARLEVHLARRVFSRDAERYSGAHVSVSLSLVLAVRPQLPSKRIRHQHKFPHIPTVGVAKNADRRLGRAAYRFIFRAADSQQSGVCRPPTRSPTTFSKCRGDFSQQGRLFTLVVRQSGLARLQKPIRQLDQFGCRTMGFQAHFGQNSDGLARDSPIFILQAPRDNGQREIVQERIVISG